MDLVDEDDGFPAFGPKQVAGPFHQFLHLLDFREHSAEGAETMAGIFFDKSGDGGFSGPRRSPQYEGTVVIPFNHIAEKGAFLEKRALSEDITDGLRSDLFSQGNIGRHLHGIDYGTLLRHLFTNFMNKFSE